MKITMNQLRRIIKEEVEKSVKEGKNLTSAEQDERAAMKKEIKSMIDKIMPRLKDPDAVSTPEDIRFELQLIDKLKAWTEMDTKQRETNPKAFKGGRSKSIADEFGIHPPSEHSIEQMRAEIAESKRNIRKK